MIYFIVKVLEWPINANMDTNTIQGNTLIDAKTIITNKLIIIIRIMYIVYRKKENGDVENACRAWILTLFSSNTRNTNDANLLGSPCGKNCLYILMKPCVRKKIRKREKERESKNPEFIYINLIWDFGIRCKIVKLWKCGKCVEMMVLW